MRNNYPLLAKRHGVRDSLLYDWFCVLAIYLPASILGQSIYSPPYTFTTLAGCAGYGSVDGTGHDARFGLPSGVVADSAGNLYVADSGSNTIRKVTAEGMVTTLAGLAGNSGSADGTGTAARFSSPSGAAVDGADNLYVADCDNHIIRKVTPEGVVTTLAGLAGYSGSADGTGSAARFNAPSGVAVDSAGNLYVADADNCTIRKVTPAGVVTTLAGLAGSWGSEDGTGGAARFNTPSGVAVDGAGNVYVADSNNDTIRKVTAGGTVTTLAGLPGGLNYGSADGTGSNARFFWPFGLALDSAGNLYVADTDNCTIRKVTPAGVVTTLAGFAGNAGNVDGTGRDARFLVPWGVAADSAGNLYVADTYNHTIRKVTAAAVVTTLAGLSGNSGSADGTGSDAQFNTPSGVAVDSAGNLYAADTDNCTIRKVTSAGVVTTLAGSAGWWGSADGTGSDAVFNSPSSLAVDSADNVYVADTDNSTIRKVTPAGVVTTLAGLSGYSGTANGTGSDARFYSPSGITVDSAGNVYVADSVCNTIRKVTPTGMVTTLAGFPGNDGSADGTGSDAEFNQPSGVAVDSAGNLYVADTYNHTIRKVTAAAAVTTLAGLAANSGSADGTGTAARFSSPSGVAVDGAGILYVADSGNHTIRKVTAEGVVTTLAGLAKSLGCADGTGSSAQFNQPYGVAVDSAGNVYVADSQNNAIRKGTPSSAVPAPVLQSPSLRAGEFACGITGLAGLAVNVQSSDDLYQWQVVGTYTLDGGTNRFTSPVTQLGTKFYRAHVR